MTGEVYAVGEGLQVSASHGRVGDGVSLAVRVLESGADGDEHVTVIQPGVEQRFFGADAEQQLRAVGAAVLPLLEQA